MSHLEADRPGQLSRTGKPAFARRATMAQLTGLPKVLRAALGLSGLGLSELGLSGRRGTAVAMPQAPPDTPITRQADDLARTAYGDELLRHCLRCWYFGDVFAQLDRQRYDAELLYVACLLHDLGLSGDFPPPPEAACFAVYGGDLARERVRSWGGDSEFANTVAAAIALHMDVRVPVESGAEAYLLHAGAHLDAAGVRAGDVPRPVLRDIVRRYPRDGFPAAFLAAMRQEAQQRPDSRAAVMWKQGMRLPVSLNPLNRISR